MNLITFSGKIHKSPYELVVERWFKENGDKTLRLNYDLSPESIVFDLGGYEGQWTSDIFSKYQPTIYVFEPVSDFYSNIIERFKHNPKVKVFPLGLGAENQFVPISIGADSSSIHRSIGDHKEIVRIVRAADFLEKENINYIHLMKINIEGGEYDLLDHLIDTGCVRRIENIQVQFHNFVPESQDRMSNLQARLAKTHIVTWQYEFVWENWRLKKGSNHYE